jgi:hypothetical protein
MRLDELNAQDLKSMVPDLENAERFGLTLDQIGERVNFQVQKDQLLSRDGLASVKELPKPYWRQVKKEMFLLICTEDSKYSTLRTEFGKHSTKTTTTVVGVVSAALASTIGVAAGVIVPLCALALYAALKVGVSAYCEIEKVAIEKSEDEA